MFLPHIIESGFPIPKRFVLEFERQQRNDEFVGTLGVIGILNNKISSTV